MNPLLILFFIILPFYSLAQTSETLKDNIRIIQQTPLPDDFTALINLRKKLNTRFHNAQSELAGLQQKYRYYESRYDDVDLSISSIQLAMATDAGTIKRLQEKEILSEEETLTLQRLESRQLSDSGEIERLKRKKKEMLDLQIDIETLKKEIEAYEDSIAPIEQKIADMLNIEEERNDFRTWVSGAFCLLVAIVIVGFYIIAYRKQQIAESIFAGEKGIQFVTIFLIVISIILFGIMGVLESKELSALLGGLSGYILGRVSGNSTPQTGNQDAG